MATNVKKTSLGKKIGRGLAACLAVILLFLTGTAVYEQIAASQSHERHPAPGKLVDAGGVQLHIRKQGQGGPTILFEGGSGGGSNYWDSIAKQLSAETTVITYDRAGYNWSGRPETERTGENIVKELHTALQNAEIEGPFILVGHSLGGMYGRLYAQEYKEDVAGLILLDARPEDFSKQTEAIFENAGLDQVTLATPPSWLVKSLRMTGLLRLFREPIMSSSYESKEDIDFAVDIMVTNKALDAIREELAEMKQVEDAIRNVHLGDLPLTIVTAGQETDYTQVGFSAEDSKKLTEEWMKQQKDMLQLSTNSKQVIAQNSYHHIPTDEPGLVIEVIQDMIKTLDQR